MENEKKAQAIVEFFEMFQNHASYQKFFEYNDLGVPLSLCYINNFVILNPEGIELIDETFKNMCKILKIDPNKDYEDLDDMLDESL
jgi:hypothetical protein